MEQHVMTGESAVERLRALGNQGSTRASVAAGPVDALLGAQTREHSDLDLWVLATDIEPLFVVFAQRGIDRILPWLGDRLWNFVLHDGERLRVDLHFDERITGGWLHCGTVANGDVFPVAALGSQGGDR